MVGAEISTELMSPLQVAILALSCLPFSSLSFCAACRVQGTLVILFCIFVIQTNFEFRPQLSLPATPLFLSVNICTVCLFLCLLNSRLSISMS